MTYDPLGLIGIWRQRRKEEEGERERDFPPGISARDILRSENKRCISSRGTFFLQQTGARFTFYAEDPL